MFGALYTLCARRARTCAAGRLCSVRANLRPHTLYAQKMRERAVNAEFMKYILGRLYPPKKM